ACWDSPSPPTPASGTGTNCVPAPTSPRRRPAQGNYAISKGENSSPDTAYFHDMILRVMRVLDYVASRPEWSRKDLLVQGTFQGGLQASWATGLAPVMTLASVCITWNCNLGFLDNPKKLRGTWHIP
ncbi:MAG: hypothetical protein SPK06_07900, partial [Kiritimatiellia bacterium]|nr:hypothetical protein [Kiritimatiellia bacterium]